MGAAGLTSSSAEMAGRGGCGIELDLSAVPLRETGMTPYEILFRNPRSACCWLPSGAAKATIKKIFDKWDLDAVVVGQVTDDQQFRTFVGRRRGGTYADRAR